MFQNTIGFYNNRPIQRYNARIRRYKIPDPDLFDDEETHFERVHKKT